MTFEEIRARLEKVGGEPVDESVLNEVEGVDLQELKSMQFDKTACYALALDRSLKELRAVSYTACRMVFAYVYDDGGEGDFILFGVPYLDFDGERKVRRAITG